MMSRLTQPVLTAIAAALLVPPVAAESDEASNVRPVETKQGRIIGVGKALRFDVSPPLAEMIRSRPEPRAYGAEAEIPIQVPEFLKNLPAVETVRDPLARGFNRGASPAALLSVEGYTSDDNSDLFGARFAPPDTNGAVGLNYFVEYVNKGWILFEKDNPANFMGPFAGNSFWTGFGGICETANAGDPIVLYDQVANRWVFSQFTGPSPARQCFAISTTGNPMGPYFRHEFDVGNQWNDYPKIGMWTNGDGTQSAYHMTSNQFTPAGSFLGAQLTAFDRDAMIAGNPGATFQTQFFPLGPPPVRFSLLPGNVEGTPPPSGTCGLYIDVFDDETWGTGLGPDGYQFWEYCVDFVTPANTILNTGPLVTTSEFDANLCCVPQPSPGWPLDTLSQFSMYPFNVRYQDGGARGVAGLWGVVSHNVDLGGDLAGVRWAQFDIPTLASASLGDTGTLDVGDGLHRWMPAAGIDQAGNIGLVYSRSGSGAGQFPSVYFAGRESGDPPGTLQSESVCVAGTGVQTNTIRWGDYSSVFVDPEDDCTFWVAGEYVETTGGFQWNTRVCAYKFDSCGAEPIFSDGFESGDTSAWSATVP